MEVVATARSAPLIPLSPMAARLTNGPTAPRDHRNGGGGQWWIRAPGFARGLAMGAVPPGSPEGPAGKVALQLPTQQAHLDVNTAIPGAYGEARRCRRHISNLLNANPRE